MAGKIDLAEKHYREAVDHLQAALRFDPSLVAAHETLRATYLAMGEKEKSAAESKEIVRLKQLEAAKGASEAPPAISAPLFTVRLPGSRDAATDR